MKHELEGTEVWCQARGCSSRVMWGSREWTAKWVSVWVETERCSFDSCSDLCSEKIEKGRYVKKKKID